MSLGGQHTDLELFALISEGEEAAFEILFNRYLPKIQPAVLKMVRNESFVRDIVQEIFLQIWLSRAKLPEIESPANWVFRITYNRTLTWLEQQASRNKILTKISMPDEYNPTEELIFFSETSRLVQRAIEQLPPQSQKIYSLHRHGFKTAEIAEQLQLSAQTIKNTIHRSAALIREYLIDNGVSLPVVLLFSFIDLVLFT